jgi:hypothetical protein
MNMTIRCFKAMQQEAMHLLSLAIFTYTVIIGATIRNTDNGATYLIQRDPTKDYLIHAIKNSPASKVTVKIYLDLRLQFLVILWLLVLLSGTLLNRVLGQLMTLRMISTALNIYVSFPLYASRNGFPESERLTLMSCSVAGNNFFIRLG